MARLPDLFMLWLLLAASAILVALAARARRLELSEGLATSRKRLAAVGAVCGAVAVLVLGTTGVTLVPLRAPQPVPSPKPAAPPDPQTAERRRALEMKLAGLLNQAASVRAELNRLSPSDDVLPPDEPVPWYAATLPPLARTLVPPLVILGTFCLVFLGDPSNLFRAGRPGRGRDADSAEMQATHDLDRLSYLADQGRFRDGLNVARGLDADRLERFDRLDYSFLKSYCAVQLVATEGVEGLERGELLDAAVRDLVTLRELAPNRGEAVYLLALAQGLNGRSADAFDSLGEAKALLAGHASGLPFAHNESVCLLRMAEDKLTQGDAAEAGRLFDEVTRRKILVDQIPSSLLKVRLLNVARSLRDGDLSGAARGVETVRSLDGLDVGQKRGTEAICDALSAFTAARGGEADETLPAVEAFLAKHWPAGLPEPDEEVADEYLDAPAAGAELRLPPPVYRVILFLQAVASARSAALTGRAPTEVEVEALTRPLFLALLFEPRQRDVLAALGGLYFWFQPGKRAKAVPWLEAAAAMGAEGRVARRLLQEARAVDLENREAMDWFRSASTRFLYDPTVSARVRDALVEELGRFEEFRPFLLELDSSPELEPREPTLRILRERAGYLERMVADLSTRRAGAVSPYLQELRRNYQRIIAGLDAASSEMAEVEMRLVQEVGKLVITQP